MVGLAAIAVIALLGFNLQSFERQSAGLEAAERIVGDWLQETELVLNNATYESGTYQLVVSGPDQPPAVADLAEAVEDEFGEAIAISVGDQPRTARNDLHLIVALNSTAATANVSSG